MTKKVNARGFTLLEILLVVGIISILAGIVILAINPTKQLGDARNAQRRSDVLTILNAAHQYSLDNDGLFPPDLASSTEDDDVCYTVTDGIGTKNTNAILASAMTELASSSLYITSMPTDPSPDGSDDYSVVMRTSGRITVCAPAAENMVDDARIEVTR